MGLRYFAPGYRAIAWPLMAVFLGLPVGAATAQAVRFDPADYGKAQLPARQSTGDATTYIDANNGAFEPIGELDAKDPIAALARPIGRKCDVADATVDTCRISEQAVRAGEPLAEDELRKRCTLALEQCLNVTRTDSQARRYRCDRKVMLTEVLNDVSPRRADAALLGDGYCVAWAPSIAAIRSRT